MKNGSYQFIFSCLIMLAFLGATGCRNNEEQVITPKRVNDYTSEVSLSWNKLFLEIERYATGYRPCPAPRALAYLGLASYEACVSGMPEYNSLEDHFPGLIIPDVQAQAEYHWPTVVHAVYTTMMSKFFTEEPPAEVRNHWNSLINELNTKYLDEAGEEIFKRSKKYGEDVGYAVWEWAATDGYGHNAYLNPSGNYETNESYDWSAHYHNAGDWRPTDPDSSGPEFPFFGKARTFALEESEKLSFPPSHYFMEYSDDPHSEYYSEALNVFTRSAAINYNEEWIGEFWNDDFQGVTFSSGSRWISIANQIIEKEDVPLDIALETYAKTGIALNDAAVGCWFSKYEYNTEQPATYIRNFIDPNYTSGESNPVTGVPFVPPYPSYPSSHAVFAGSGAEVLSSIFGYVYAMTDNSHLGRTEFKSTPRTFNSLMDMANEDAWSRREVGANWNIDCLEGVRFGTEIARKVDQLPWKK